MKIPRPERWLRWAAGLALIGLALVVWSLVDPTPVPVIVSMTLAQVVGTLSFGLYIAVVAFDLRRGRRRPSPSRPTDTPPRGSDSAAPEDGDAPAATPESEAAAPADDDAPAATPESEAAAPADDDDASAPAGKSDGESDSEDSPEDDDDPDEEREP